MRRFSQVDVFSSEPLAGNPVAVVHDADGLDAAQMQRFAQWTNLSETTFLLPPSDHAADYRLRIFTPGGELPFAGHPTIGSAHAWLEAGGAPRSAVELVQECGAGLVRVRRGQRLAFAAPPLLREGPVSAEERVAVLTALALTDDDVVDLSWGDNGPGWVVALLRDASAVLAVRPDWSSFGDLDIGVVGAYPADSPCAVEVRAFSPGLGVVEDPVTGSLNASIGQWLAGDRLPTSYVASQGTALGRAGRVYVERDGDTVWVGGDATTTVSGTVELGP
ncbi:MAG TPA: PhzF family phenazine biosynthesis protein [Nocardioides sp.]|jgi:PhzF family phenazine biosynthesis protein|uniref:PhzF family phenazine biosynthesis protein n=1 Tax=Nocardioides sp. TaxID=35761 RepID=UPI002E314EAF|nr:PhzF family phenazine biosynthesis protein [Nocardioides sp.]HEX3929073.1 PhzF family phenazine biosynthesis protein [Nocardioides sp.]